MKNRSLSKVERGYSLLGMMIKTIIIFCLAVASIAICTPDTPEQIAQKHAQKLVSAFEKAIGYGVEIKGANVNEVLEELSKHHVVHLEDASVLLEPPGLTKEQMLAASQFLYFDSEKRKMWCQS